MSAPTWLREERDAAATERILDAAGRLFADVGVAATGMAEIASAAGCSRATVYRYFASRDALRAAFVRREAVRIGRGIADALRSARSDRERVEEGVVLAVQAVRARPDLAAWFTDAASGIGIDQASSSVLIESFADEFLAGVGPDDDRRERARWLVRTIVSLLTMPGDSPGHERSLVERFVVPVVVPA